MMKIISMHPDTPKATIPASYDFDLPYQLECAKPTEERGMDRDEVRLLVSRTGTDEISHSTFRYIDQFLQAGDVLVVNTSGTLKAALEAFMPDGKMVRVHFSTKLDDHKWVVEIREVVDGHTRRYPYARRAEVLALKHGGSLELLAPYYQNPSEKHLKLWKARINLPISLEEYLTYYGKPIRYQHVKESYPQAYYQTIFAQEMGSVEMPSAGRPFTPELVTRLVAQGIQIVPILLHTGVASLELDERPYDEFFRVPPVIADTVNLARSKGRRIIAVGTTVIRALESAAGPGGRLQPRAGWTDIFISPQRGLRAVDGLLTGFHEPKASHLLMLEALAGSQHLKLSYQAAIAKQYYWHEFGDVHLILP